MEGICEDAKLTYILRNHSKQSFIAQKQKMEEIADKMNENTEIVFMYRFVINTKTCVNICMGICVV